MGHAKNLQQISDMWDEIHEKEIEQSDLMAQYEGLTIEYKGRSGVIKYLDPPNKVVSVSFDNKTSESLSFKELADILN